MLKIFTLIVAKSEVAFRSSLIGPRLFNQLSQSLKALSHPRVPASEHARKAFEVRNTMEIAGKQPSNIQNY